MFGQCNARICRKNYTSRIDEIGHLRILEFVAGVHAEGPAAAVYRAAHVALPDLDLARELAAEGDFDTLETLFGESAFVLSELIRPAFIPSEGCRFVVSDFSAIEARVIAWLADEQWTLDAFRAGEDIYCPMFPEGSADIIIGFEPAEAVRMLPFLKKGGQVVVNTHPIMPVTATLKGSDYTGREMTDYISKNVENALFIDGESACREIGSPKVLNMIMLGAAVNRGVLPFSLDDIEQTMIKTVKPQFHELNSKALHYSD